MSCARVVGEDGGHHKDATTVEGADVREGGERGRGREREAVERRGRGRHRRQGGEHSEGGGEVRAALHVELEAALPWSVLWCERRLGGGVTHRGRAGAQGRRRI